MINNTNVSSITVKVENRRKINVDVYKNHETTPTMNLSPGDRATFSTSTASARDSEITAAPQLDSIQFESCGFVYHPRCDIRYLEISGSKDSPVELLKAGDGDDKPIVSVTLGQDEPPGIPAPTGIMACSAMFGGAVGLGAAPFIYNVSPIAWGITLAASVIAGIVIGLISRAKQK